MMKTAPPTMLPAIALVVGGFLVSLDVALSLHASGSAESRTYNTLHSLPGRDKAERGIEYIQSCYAPDSTE